MLDSLLQALGWAGESLDKPGASVRGLLAGRPDQLMNLVPFSDTLGLTDPSRRTSGSGLLAQHMGMDPESPWTKALGFGTELATDPLNWLGGLGVGKLFGARKAALANNTRRESLLAAGAMPEEVARLTKAVDEAGQPLRLYHGTADVFDTYDMAKADPGGLHGPGVYMTADPGLANSYALLADSRLGGGGHPQNVRMQYLDARHPFSMDWRFSPQEQQQMARAIGPDADFLRDAERNLTGQDIYQQLSGNRTRKALATGHLRAAGYDSILKPAGSIVNGQLHDIWMALDPSRIYSPWLAPAQRSASLSPLLTAMAGVSGHNALARSY